jgi:hypothetical protein
MGKISVTPVIRSSTRRAISGRATTIVPFAIVDRGWIARQSLSNTRE